MPRFRLYIVAIAIPMLMLFGCATKREGINIVSATAFSADSLMHRPYRPDLKTIANDELLIFAPFCNWDNDTIILERDKYNYLYYAQSVAHDLFCVTSVNIYEKTAKQKIFTSIEEYMVPLETLPPGMRCWAQECIDAHINIKNWDTDAIERRIYETGGIKQSGDELQRIIVQNGEIISVERYVYTPFAPIISRFIRDTDKSDWKIKTDVKFPEDPQPDIYSVRNPLLIF